MRYQKLKSSLFQENRRKFSMQMADNSAALFFSNDQSPRNGDQYHPYRQQSDFFYLTGIEQEKSIFLLAPSCPNEQLREALFLLKPEKTMEIWEGHKLTKEEAIEISGVKNVFWIEEFDVSIKEVFSSLDHIYLNRNEYVKFLPEVESREERLGKKLKEQYPLYQYHRAAPLLAKQRLIKSAVEIELLKKACEITNKAFRRVLRFARPDVWEFEVEAEVSYEFTRNRASGHGYAPIVASGKNGCVLHYTENDKKCKNGDLLLMDFGAEYANYTADMSRTIPVNGKFTPRQKACYKAVLNVMKTVKKMYVPGNTINDINKEANALMEKEMISLGLFTEEQRKQQPEDAPYYKRWFMHGTSHFLGLDVHDVGAKTEPLQPGMVLTCEPGIYLPEEEIGIRIENDILITKNEPVDLMEDFPITAEEIESLMKKVF